MFQLIFNFPMKKILFSLTLLLAMVMVSCSHSIDDIERTYQHGIERAQVASTPEELTQITIDVRNELIEGAKGIGSDRKLSPEEMRRYDNAKRAFQNAVDKRYYELTGQYGTWR